MDWYKTSLIIVIDKEHLEELGDIKRQLVNFFHYEIKQEDKDNQYFEFEIQRGPKKAILYVVVMGFKKCIEGNISRLIRERFGEEVPPEKQNIKQFLRGRKMKIEDLIRDSSERALNNAFNNLMRLLRKIDR